MSAHLSNADLATVVGMLDGWVGALSWASLVNAIQLKLGTKYSRQALDRHWQIKNAFQTAKVRLGGGESSPLRGSVETVALQQRNARLEAEVARLKRENDALVERFHRWAYNAHSRGMSEAQLDRALPGIDRSTPRG